MKTLQEIWTCAILRALIVTVLIMIVGFAFYRFWIFDTSMMPFQFTLSGVTAGIAYATAKGPSIRNGLAVLFLWYFVLTSAIFGFNTWLMKLDLIYVAGIAAAIFFYDYFVKKPFFNMAIKRIILAGVLVAVVNGLIIVILSTIASRAMVWRVASTWYMVYKNTELGALIGLAGGCGIEIAEYVVAKYGSRLTAPAPAETKE
jgi:hypothetical protein